MKMVKPSEHHHIVVAPMRMVAIMVPFRTTAIEFHAQPCAPADLLQRASPAYAVG